MPSPAPSHLHKGHFGRPAGDSFRCGKINVPGRLPFRPRNPFLTRAHTKIRARPTHTRRCRRRLRRPCARHLRTAAGCFYFARMQMSCDRTPTTCERTPPDPKHARPFFVPTGAGARYILVLSYAGQESGPDERKLSVKEMLKASQRTCPTTKN